MKHRIHGPLQGIPGPQTAGALRPDPRRCPRCKGISLVRDWAGPTCLLCGYSPIDALTSLPGETHPIQLPG